MSDFTCCETDLRLEYWNEQWNLIDAMLLKIETGPPVFPEPAYDKYVAIHQAAKHLQVAIGNLEAQIRAEIFAQHLER